MKPHLPTVRPNNTTKLLSAPHAIAPEAELELETPRFVIRLRIRGTKCRLLGPDLPELKRLLNAPSMGAGRLIMELERAGKKKVFPKESDVCRGASSKSALHDSKCLFQLVLTCHVDCRLSFRIHCIFPNVAVPRAPGFGSSRESPKPRRSRPRL